jgi:predicted nucleic acid-binding protein
VDIAHPTFLLFNAIDSGLVIGCVTATTLTDIFYIAQKHTRSIEQARQAVAEILTVMTICPVDRAVLESAFNSGLTDFEDAVQIFCAVTQGLDAILTRDKRGFVSSPVPVLSIGELLQQLGSKNSD